MTDINSKYIIWKGYEKEDKIIVQNFYDMWIDIGMESNDIHENWMEITLNKIKENRKELKLTTIVIVDDKEKIIGSAVCQIYNTNSLHPHIIKYTTLQSGYIWGVYVKSDFRNKGLGKKLIEECNKYCKEIGCSEIKLWASEKGKAVYKHAGYDFINEGIQEMILTFK